MGATSYESGRDKARFAPIAALNSGANVIVPAVTGQWLFRIVAYNFIANGTVNVKWQSGSTDLTGLSYLVANCGKVAPFSDVGWFETNAAEALNLNLSGSVAVGGEVVYYLLKA